MSVYQDRIIGRNYDQQERRDEIRSLVKCNVPDEFLPIYNPDSWAEEKGLDAADVLYQYLLSIGMTNKDDMYPKEIILPVQKPGEFFYDYKKRIRDEVRELKIKSYNESPLRKTSLWKKPNDITSVLEETSDKLIPDDVVDTVLLSSSINSDWSIEQIRNMYGKYCSSQPCKIEMDDCVIRCKAPPLVARTYHGDVLIVFPTAKVCSDTYNLLKTVYVKNPKTSKEERWATTYMAKNYVLRLSMPDRFAPNNKSGKKRYHYPDYSGLIDYKGKHPRGKDPIEQKRNWIVEQRQRVDYANGVYGATYISRKDALHESKADKSTNMDFSRGFKTKKIDFFTASNEDIKRSENIRVEKEMSRAKTTPELFSEPSKIVVKSKPKVCWGPVGSRQNC